MFIYILGFILVVSAAGGLIYFIHQEDKKGPANAKLEPPTLDFPFIKKLIGAPATPGIKTKKCKFCFTKLGESALVCDVCNIECNKNKKTVTNEEKKIWHCCRNLYIISTVNGAGAIVGLITGIIMLFAIKSINLIFGPLMVLIVCGFILYFSISLRKYEQWCYIGGIILYLFLIITGLITRHTPGLFTTVFLAIIAGPTAKKILYRKSVKQSPPPQFGIIN